jgi:2-polyprenyl-3-methyl-5-hydroxy-6-metoxy-1,4-benzoquinol methylase
VLCATCTSSDTQAHYEIKKIGLRRCRGCGLVFAHPQPDPEQILEAYQEEYFRSSEHLDWGYEDYFQLENEIRKTSRKRLRIIERYISKGDLLEVGAATGWFLDEARKSGFDVHGVELSDFAADWGRTHLGLPIQTGTLEQAGFGDASFSLATLWDVLEHVSDPVGQLREVNRVLKPGGYLFASIPDVGSPLARLMGRKWFGFAKVREHLFFFTREAITAGLERAGFEVVHVQKSPIVISTGFMTRKMSQYSRPLSGVLESAMKKIGCMDATFDFNVIDMLVVARKIG